MPKSGPSSCSKSPDSWKFLSWAPPLPHPQFSPDTLCFGRWKSPQQGKKRLVFRGLRAGPHSVCEIKERSAFVFCTLAGEWRGPYGGGGWMFDNRNHLQRTRLERNPSSGLQQPHAAESRLPDASCPRAGRLLFQDGAVSCRGGISRPVCQQPSPLCVQPPPAC